MLQRRRRHAPETCGKAGKTLGTGDSPGSSGIIVVVQFGRFAYDSRRRSLTRDGVEVHLTPKAFLLLESLTAAAPAPVAREDLYRALWPDVVVEPGNLHGLVAELRAALDDDEHRIIRTIHRVGYAFGALTPETAPPRFAIVIGGDELPLPDGTHVIGRDPRDAISIPLAEVSRHHARLVVGGARVTIEDLGSKNGTYVGRTRVTAPVVVTPGDEILVGTVCLRLIRVDPLASTRTAG
jgi:DNA-binding winged helix-turn-helix (wHTH) protein